MPGFVWLLRMSRWARRPPSMRRVMLGLAVVALCLILYAINEIWGWPTWLTPNQVPHGRLLR